MVDVDPARAARLRDEFHAQTARIDWHELQKYFAHGNLIWVEQDLDLVDVAVQLRLDNVDQFECWTSAQRVAPVTDAQALAWHDDNVSLWAVVAPPWVLVQQRIATT